MVYLGGIAVVVGSVLARALALESGKIDHGSSPLSLQSRSGAMLMSQARSLEDGGGYDLSFLTEYSVKFQGCHHISQWNDEAEDEDDVRIFTKRLVRFRLCPSWSCDSSEGSSGCNSKYGDYVVDLHTFVAAYLQADADEREYQCERYANVCGNACQESDDDGCQDYCYADNGVEYCLEDDADDDNAALANFDILDYAYCGQFDLNGRRRRLDDDEQYYLGPFCAAQGGEIQLGLFTDDTCTTFSSCNDECFQETMGFSLPYSERSLVSRSCMSCAELADGDDGGGENDGDDDQAAQDNQNYQLREMCGDVYPLSGKCETKMSVEYPNESACTYIEGIKIIRDDGVIRTSSVKKSKAAAICIGLFITVAVLLGAYVYYLRTKLGRAKINLSSSGSMA